MRTLFLSMKLWLSFGLLLRSIVAQTQDNSLQQVANDAFSFYKHIHQYPELGKKEMLTADFIIGELKQSGFTEFITVPGLPTAVISILKTQKPGSTVGLRAEMDARPGKEESGLPYASTIDSVHHNCGHDAHAAILLAIAKHFMRIKKKLSGRIVFIFQPAEEVAGGADEIVDSKLLDSLNVSQIFALHAATDLPVGTIGISPGYITARSTSFAIFLKGRGSHAAMPYMGDDMPVVTSQLVISLANLPARRMDVSMRPCVISPAIIQVGKTATNVLSPDGVIRGTIRSYEHPDTPVNHQPSIKTLIRTLIAEICGSRGISDSTVFGESGSPTLNHPQLYSTVLPTLHKHFSGKIDETPFKSMAAEDFALYTLERPCLYFSWGVAKDNFGRFGVHTPQFSIHPDAFMFGVELFADLVLSRQ